MQAVISETLPFPLIFFQIDVLFVFKADAFSRKQIFLLVPTGHQPAAVVDNAVAGIISVVLRPS